MISRVSERMRFNLIVNNLFNAQAKHSELLEQMATQKKINRPSDDPLGMSRVLDYRKTEASIEQYRQNIDYCNGWYAMTESKLSGAGNLLRNAEELAVAQSTGTATAETRTIVAERIQTDIIDGMIALANSRYGEMYLFSGSKTDVQPFSSSVFAATIEDPVSASENNFDGTVASGGAYTGTVNKTYVVKIETGGTFAAAEYRVSADGGKNWGGVQTDLDTGTITLGDGIAACGPARCSSGPPPPGEARSCCPAGRPDRTRSPRRPPSRRRSGGTPRP